MSNVIQALEQMGSNANCQSKDAINSLLNSAELDSDITESITTADIISLERQLDVRIDIVCSVHPAEDDEEKEKDDDKDKEETSNKAICF